ncbi:Carbamoyl-phosphate synthase small chain [Liberibacter crescens BT-1]|uniref:Carbamoyl phosphate synthase small chain n=1 Tax=Liberibacter crescens (strain BT-1) TaxID=1215343 RepID=L0ETK4_LIBCB|nr:glutamine-hydrolyzing carbamoyl-phosphate synthase small subunit [Liberibacter crescens]AGA64160.1 Carbamoyl-phosphate synthase small chain [Liberibacter crescens BT-1]AMC12426.1 carbamoyl-phosphate synthase [Liberibacter crescens]
MTITAPWTVKKPTAILVLEDGSVIEGKGFGAIGSVQAEVCFNTALTGYEEILTDPSYVDQIVTFTCPHIGNVGVNNEDCETLFSGSFKGPVGLIIKADITEPSNYRSVSHLDIWLKEHGIIGLSGVDTRALTIWIRKKGVPNAVIAHHPSGDFDIGALRERAKIWCGLKGCDLAKVVTSEQNIKWLERSWQWNKKYSLLCENDVKCHVVCIDYGVKRNILRVLANLGCKVSVVTAKSSFEEIMALTPDGVVLSNGPGDPSAMIDYALPVIRKLIDTGLPIFGICLGHQLLGLALGAVAKKMHQGHHGANHPVKNCITGKVEIVSMNHGFTIDSSTFPKGVEETHISLFDGSNCGLRLVDKPVFSVQYHPEASPGPQDSYYLFSLFMENILEKKQKS